MTATPPAPSSTDTPKRGVIAAAIALGAHALVVLAGFLAAQMVDASGGGFQDIAAAVATVLAGEIITGLACVIVSAVQYRRGQRYTGLGLMGGWIAGFVAIMALLCL